MKTEEIIQSEEEIKHHVNRLADVANQVAHRAKEAAEHTFNTVRTKADEAVTTSKGYVRENPVPVVLGMLAIGFAAGFVMARREEPTFRDRFLRDPARTTHDTLYAMLAPIAERLGDQYSAARSTAEHALDKIQQHYPGHHDHSWLDQFRRMSNNLKFW